MNRTVIIAAVLTASASFLSAGQTQQSPAPAPPTAASASAPAQADSPLVAAAKKAKKSANKKIVITNENLLHASEGSFTTTKTQPEFDHALISGSTGSLATKPDLSMQIPPDVAKRLGLTGDDKAPAGPEAAKRGLTQLTTAYDNEGFLGDDPARIEHQLEELSKAAQPQPVPPAPKQP